MKIYISSSWKNRENVREMALRLREDGHKVFDFTDPECRKTEEFPHEKRPKPYDSKKHKSYSTLLRNSDMYAAVMNNQEAIRWCDLVVLLLPCGLDAHADWAYGLGLGKATIIVGTPRDGDTVYTHCWADKVFDDPEDIYHFILTHY